jgi:crotonobetainyl-CoA:carnitine CoA-transferase CaiB-like acyl-CoA transferase
MVEDAALIFDGSADVLQPLDGIKVLDLTGAIGAYCTRLLADLGADVVKVEPPWGDPMRRRPPFRNGVPELEQSLLFSAYHANKRGVTLDVAAPDVEPVLARLGVRSDVVVVSPSRRSPVTGLDRDTPILRWAPDAVVAGLTPFGMTGPMRDFRATPFVSFAMGGRMHRTGDVGGPPVTMPGQEMWDFAGIHSALGIIAALGARPRLGGQVIDVSVHEVAAALDFLVERYDIDGGAWDGSVPIGVPPTGTWQCRDGALEVQALQQRHWDAFLEMLDHPSELSEPALADPLVRREAFEALIEIIETLMAARGCIEVFERGQAAGLPCNPLHTPAEFSGDIHARERGLFVAATQKGMESIELPWRSFASEPPVLRLRRPAPLLGEHNMEVFVDELGYSSDDLQRWKEAGLA